MTEHVENRPADQRTGNGLAGDRAAALERRRSFLAGGVLVGSAMATLPSRTALAGADTCSFLSHMTSANPSQQFTPSGGCFGRTPGIWKQQKAFPCYPFFNGKQIVSSNDMCTFLPLTANCGNTVAQWLDGQGSVIGGSGSPSPGTIKNIAGAMLNAGAFGVNYGYTIPELDAAMSKLLNGTPPIDVNVLGDALNTANMRDRGQPLGGCNL
jgi:hypothetical protein